MYANLKILVLNDGSPITFVTGPAWMNGTQLLDWFAKEGGFDRNLLTYIEDQDIPVVKMVCQ
jgi:hypothetical protein